MPDRSSIYRNDPQTYDLLISREDYQENIPKMLRSIRDFSGLDVADIGAGAGRLAMLLAKDAKSLLLTDNAEPMLKLAAEKLRRIRYTHFHTEVCDFTKIPVADRSLDVVVEGWALCTTALRSPSWEATLTNSISE